MSNTTSSVRTFKSQTTLHAERAEPNLAENNRKGPFKKVYLIFAVIAVLLASTVFLFVQYQSAQQKLSNTQQSEKLLREVGRIVVLPTGETPTIATVAHADKLKTQKFFEAARDGDKVIVYTKHNQAILYRPSSHQIVTISTIKVDSTSTTP